MNPTAAAVWAADQVRSGRRGPKFGDDAVRALEAEGHPDLAESLRVVVAAKRTLLVSRGFLSAGAR